MLLKYFRLKRLQCAFPHSKIESDKVSLEARIGRDVLIKSDVSIGKNVQIGDHSYVNSYTDIHEAKIGKFCSIAGFCAIGLDSHPVDWISTSPKLYSLLNMTGDEGYKEPKAYPVIGNDVWIGSHSIILRGIEIGNGAIIGAGSVVTKDVPPYAIFAGVPAKLIKYRFDIEIIQQLTNLNWWDMDQKELDRLKKDILLKDNFYSKW
jgi:virginiamycin A acetyltransferase